MSITNQNPVPNPDHQLVLALIGLVGLLFFILSSLIILFLRHQTIRQEIRRLCRSSSSSTNPNADQSNSSPIITLPSYPSPVLEQLLSPSSRTHINLKQSHRPGTGTTTLRPSTANTFKSKISTIDLKQQLSPEINPIIREQNQISPIDRSITCVEWYSEQIETRPRITSSGSGKIYDILPCPADPLIITNRPCSLNRLSTVLPHSPTRFSISTSLEPQPDLEEETKHSKLDQTLFDSDRIDVRILNLNTLTIEEPKDDDDDDLKKVEKEEDVDDGISLESDEFYHRRRRNKNNSRPDTANTIVPGT
ncbi:hypothetical protein CROQUDRAFT_658583 [Cronartium quercuum f. sp. fusiforme G11]|uniref:Uncharacterized protein n=1 Tax=Cronartium quercuum f. sp. fusiforme G11 TaxID=708437 RepID=A0A9P6NL37_9BASI|nr:hypothetical protein CROQUDRAFT_658583 [Cronartium quercuum f. sp. fusiforme G11]